ncbi:MAG: PA2778 family cysteine peptidase [Gammaproteobacteria bacterium]|nr:PA2778 family cysteine peptidase [Gammaproteobacteria bacterium]
MPQTRLMINHASTFPLQYELKDVPFFPQEEYQCGPASLATLLTTKHISVTPEELKSKVYLPQRKGSLQLEMIASVRQYDLVPYVLKPELSDLFTEVIAGNPVLVLQNLGLDWFPVWHYAVVVGFNMQTQEVILRSGTTQRQLTDMSVFERTWARSNRWAMVIVAPNQTPATANELDFLKSAAKFEKIGKFKLAEQAYNAALIKWPKSLNIRLALANNYYSLKDYEQAERILKEAIEIHPDSMIAHNNLAHILMVQNKLLPALSMAKKALELAGGANSVAQQTYQQIQKRITDSHQP